MSFLEDSHFIKVKIQQHWDLLVQELEPCQLLMCFVKEGLMTKPEEQIIRSCRQRQTMVAAFLKILLKASEERTFEYFVQLLRQLNKKDIADRLYCRDTINVHQDAGNRTTEIEKSLTSFVLLPLSLSLSQNAIKNLIFCHLFLRYISTFYIVPVSVRLVFTAQAFDFQLLTSFGRSSKTKYSSTLG